MTTLHYRLPWPPSVNRLYRYTPAGVKLSEVGRKYVLAVCRALPVGKVTRLKDRLIVHMIVHAPNARARDLDNLCKATLDACTKACVWADDSLIDELHIARGEVDPDGEGYVDMLIETT